MPNPNTIKRLIVKIKPRPAHHERYSDRIIKLKELEFEMGTDVEYRYFKEGKFKLNKSDIEIDFVDQSKKAYHLSADFETLGLEGRPFLTGFSKDTLFFRFKNCDSYLRFTDMLVLAGINEVVENSFVRSERHKAKYVSYEESSVISSHSVKHSIKRIPKPRLW